MIVHVTRSVASIRSSAQRLRGTSAMPQCVTAGPTFFLDPFALRQWDAQNDQAMCIDYDKVKFVEKIHELYAKGLCPLRDGYAPFCKHLFVENFVDMRSGVIEITEENVKLLKSQYIQRRPEELAVLTRSHPASLDAFHANPRSRWFAKDDVDPPVARYLDIILYSRDQIVQETQSLPYETAYDIPDIPWGIISIKSQMEV